MDQYSKARNTLLEINRYLSDVLEQARSMPDAPSQSALQWGSDLERIARQLKEDTVRVAVVGAIKSGKSTLVNAMLGGDYLKRGAGVVTSIVTRIRNGRRLNANLFFKSWDDINAEIEQALVLFPTGGTDLADQRFDIRRTADRQALEKALSGLDAEAHLAHDGFNANGVLLNCYLKGYDQVSDLVSADLATRQFSDDQFAQHRSFVGDDALAVYLKDIELQIQNPTLADHIEVADCQGSDSPNPLHLAMIQDYLVMAHLVVYVISSRTGLRQADIRFLSMIKRMGIAGNILFVCNCDFSEHDSLEDLTALTRRVRDELAMVIAEPRIFSMSALYRLFHKDDGHLSEKDKARLGQWRLAEDLIQFSDENSRQFDQFLSWKLTGERSALLLANHLHKMQVIVDDIRRWIQLNRDFLAKDASDAAHMSDRLKEHQDRMAKMQAMVKSTLDGALRKIGTELKGAANRFFDPHSGPLLSGVIDFIRQYRINSEQYRQQLLDTGFATTLYQVYQVFKQALDAYMAEQTNPEILRFIMETEQRLARELAAVGEPFKAMTVEAFGQFSDILTEWGLAPPAMDQNPTSLPLDMMAAKQALGLSLPPAGATMRYSARIKTEAVMRLGFYRLVCVVQKVLKKADQDPCREQRRALEDGVRRMKVETERSVRAHFKDYCENIKFQYLIKLADAATRQMGDALMAHYQAHVDDLAAMVASLDSSRADKQQVAARLDALTADLDGCGPKLADIRSRVETLRRQAATSEQS